MKQNIIQNAGSFRDPMGHIYESHQRIYRFISEEGRKQYESILSSIDDAVRQGYLVLSQEISKEHWPTNNSNIAYVAGRFLIFSIYFEIINAPKPMPNINTAKIIDIV